MGSFRRAVARLLRCAPLVLAAGCCRAGAAEGRLPLAVLEAERRAQVASAGIGYDAAVVHPFLLVSTGGREIHADAARAIAWASTLLRAGYFEAEPGVPITIWVFPDEGSYMSGSSALLGIVPTTPYGFYRPCKQAMVVNAGYGWGTLVHEMVHAYMDADAPDAAVWMQEGLASLFEAPVEVGGRIRGATNWRLAGLQAALRQGVAPSFVEMAGASRGDFDGARGALHYATARYLLYWLQENELLSGFYRAYRARASRDRRGLAVLSSVTGREAAALRREWEAFVLGLTYRRS
jgi:hypothetical protein